MEELAQAQEKAIQAATKAWWAMEIAVQAIADADAAYLKACQGDIALIQRFLEWDKVPAKSNLLALEACNLIRDIKLAIHIRRKIS